MIGEANGKPLLPATVVDLQHHRENDGEVEVELSEEVEEPEDAEAPPKFKFSWRKLFKFMVLLNQHWWTGIRSIRIKSYLCFVKSKRQFTYTANLRNIKRIKYS